MYLICDNFKSSARMLDRQTFFWFRSEIYKAHTNNTSLIEIFFTTPTIGDAIVSTTSTNVSKVP